MRAEDLDALEFRHRYRFELSTGETIEAHYLGRATVKRCSRGQACQVIPCVLLAPEDGPRRNIPETQIIEAVLL